MTRDEFKPGDLVECYGKRFVISSYICWSMFPHGVPATKNGGADKRFDGQYINPEQAKLIARQAKES